MSPGVERIGADRGFDVRATEIVVSDDPEMMVIKEAELSGDPRERAGRRELAAASPPSRATLNQHVPNR